MEANIKTVETINLTMNRKEALALYEVLRASTLEKTASLFTEVLDETLFNRDKSVPDRPPLPEVYYRKCNETPLNPTEGYQETPYWPKKARKKTLKSEEES